MIAPKTFSFLIIIGLSFALWAASFALASQLSGNSFWLHLPGPEIAAPDGLDILRKEAFDKPLDTEALSALAQRLEEVGFDQGNAELIIEALDTYRRILEINPGHSQSILHIAQVSAQMGVFDKAAEHFEKYLELNPNDLVTAVDAAVARYKAGDAALGHQKLKSLVDANPKDFYANFAYAMLLADSGEPVAAKDRFVISRSLAPTPEAGEQVDEAISAISYKEGLTSPAESIFSFFSSHHILGNKIERFRWLNPTTLNIEVRDFPVANMPPVARAQLRKSLSQILSGSTEIFTIRLVDQGNKSTLLDFVVGPGTDQSDP